MKGRLSEAEKTPIEDDDEKVRQVAVLGRDHLESFGTTTWMMHILNITPDSFSDGGSFLSADRQELNKVAVLESAQSTVLSHQSTSQECVPQRQFRAERVLLTSGVSRRVLGHQPCPKRSKANAFSPSSGRMCLPMMHGKRFDDSGY